MDLNQVEERHTISNFLCNEHDNEEKLGMGRDKFTLFEDMEKAFDCAPQMILSKILSEPPFSVPKKLIRVIRTIYSDSVSILGRVKETDWF